MPGPKMGPRPPDFDENVIRQSPTFKRWMNLKFGEPLRYACRDFVKGRGDDEERLMRRIMIARRNNLRDHEILKRARKEVKHGDEGEDYSGNNNKQPQEEKANTVTAVAAAAATPTTAVVVAVTVPVPRKEENKNEEKAPAVQDSSGEQQGAAEKADGTKKDSAPSKDMNNNHDSNNTETNDSIAPAGSDASTLATTTTTSTGRRRRPPDFFGEDQVTAEMDVEAVISTRSYRAWLDLPDGEEFVYNQKYTKGKEGQDWLLRKNIWRRMRYRRENKRMVEKLRKENADQHLRQFADRTIHQQYQRQQQQPGQAAVQQQAAASAVGVSNTATPGTFATMMNPPQGIPMATNSFFPSSAVTTSDVINAASTATTNTDVIRVETAVVEAAVAAAENYVRNPSLVTQPPTQSPDGMDAQAAANTAALDAAAKLASAAAAAADAATKLATAAAAASAATANNNGSEHKDEDVVMTDIHDINNNQKPQTNDAAAPVAVAAAAAEGQPDNTAGGTSASDGGCVGKENSSPTVGMELLDIPTEAAVANANSDEKFEDEVEHIYGNIVKHESV